MKRTFFAAVAALGLASVPSAWADGPGGVTVGGWIEVIGGTSDNDGAGGVDGIDRGFYSRLEVGYDATLDSGLEVAGRIAYQLNQRGNGDPTSYDPDVLFISVGGGFGTLTAGAAPPASCATLPRPIGVVNGVDTTYYELFSGLEMINPTFSEFEYCDTPEQVSYATPVIGGFQAMVTWAPDNESDQGTPLKNAQDDSTISAVVPAPTPTNPSATMIVQQAAGQGGDNIKDRMDIAATWTASMGVADISLGAGYQQGRYQDGRGDLSSTTVAGEVGLGSVTLGAAWYDTEEGEDKADKHDGYSLAASYGVGNLSLGTTWSAAEKGDGSQEDTALVVGASYAVGGGLTTWLEYYDLETDQSGTSGGKATSDDVIILGLTLGF